MSTMVENDMLRESVTQDMSIRSDTKDMFIPKSASPKNTLHSKDISGVDVSR
jgi:hypothetical protein